MIVSWVGLPQRTACGLVSSGLRLMLGIRASAKRYEGLFPMLATRNKRLIACFYFRDKLLPQ